MSKESLEQFVDKEFLRQGPTQDKLKATDSFDDFVNLMVRLGNPKYSFTAEEVKAFVQDEINRQKKKIQDPADQDKQNIEKEDLSGDIKDSFKAERQATADKLKEQIDDAVTTKWKDNRIAEISIANIKGDDVLPLY